MVIPVEHDGTKYLCGPLDVACILTQTSGKHFLALLEQWPERDLQADPVKLRIWWTFPCGNEGVQHILREFVQHVVYICQQNVIYEPIPWNGKSDYTFLMENWLNLERTQPNRNARLLLVSQTTNSHK